MKQLLSVIIALAFAYTTASAQQSLPPAAVRDVKIMTQNLYHGVDAEIFAIPNATSFPDLLQRVAAVYQAYFVKDFSERAKAIADDVENTRPDLIALQEAILVRTQSPPDGPATPATTIVLDFAETLQRTLEARGLHYDIVVQSTNFDAELPSSLGFDVRHTDRDVILARSDLSTSELKLSSAQAGNFAINCTIPTAIIGPITITRGWTSVDVKSRGKSFRLVNTHLESDCGPFTNAIQQAQTAELLTKPGATDLPLLLVGDLNSPADGTGVVYSGLIGSGFVDVWSKVGLGDGFTCCQAPDLLNGASLLGQRIDFILFRGGWTALHAENVGGSKRIARPPACGHPIMQALQRNFRCPILIENGRRRKPAVTASLCF